MRVTSFGAAALIASLSAAPASAEMTRALCETAAQAASEQTALPLLLEAPNFTLEDGACVTRDLFAVFGQIRVLVEEVRLDLVGLPALLDGPVYLDRAEITLSGLRLVPSTGLPEFDYAYMAQARANEAIDAVFLATYQDGRLSLERLEIDFPGDNRIEARLELTEIDPDPRRAAEARLASLNVAIQSNGLFENYALNAVAASLLRGSQDPEADVEAYKGQGIAALQSLPLPEASTEALTRLIADMPNPTGWLRLSLEPEGGVALADLAQPFGPAEGFLAALEVSYEPR